MQIMARSLWLGQKPEIITLHAKNAKHMLYYAAVLLADLVYYLRIIKHVFSLLMHIVRYVCANTHQEKNIQ